MVGRDRSGNTENTPNPDFAQADFPRPLLPDSPRASLQSANVSFTPGCSVFYTLCKITHKEPKHLKKNCSDDFKI